MDRCLKPDEIRAFLTGSLSVEEKARIEAHASSCKGCREALDTANREGSAPDATCTVPEEPSATVTLASGDGQRPADANLIQGYEILNEIHRGG